jgi:hypothetical protein
MRMDVHDVVLLTIPQQSVDTEMKRGPTTSHDLYFFVFRLAALRSLRTRVFF